MFLFKIKLWPSFSQKYRITIACCTCLLVICVALGYSVWLSSPVLAEQAVTQLIKMKFSDLVEKMQVANWFGKFGIIFSNNLLVSLLIILTGGILPILPIILGIFPNGFIIGLMAGFFEYKQILTKGNFFLSLIPHGVFEIPAIIISAAVGMVWGAWNWRSLFKSTNSEWIISNLRETLTFLPLIITLLFIAAFMEVSVSPYLFST